MLAEPAMTNNQGVIQPAPGFHDALRQATRDTGTVLVLDETHTQICGPGRPDRAGSASIPTSSRSASRSAAACRSAPTACATSSRRVFLPEPWDTTGGTLFGSALQLAACRATLAEVLVDDAYANAARLGARIADGIEAAAAEAGLPWCAQRLYARSGYSFGGRLPHDASEARADLDPELWSLLRVWHANRGVWEAIDGAGPAASVPMGDAEVDRYLESLGELVAALTR